MATLNWGGFHSVSGDEASTDEVWRVMKAHQAAIDEAQTCDDINLDQPLAGIIADLQKDRERLYAKLKDIAEGATVIR